METSQISTHVLDLRKEVGRRLGSLFALLVFAESLLDQHVKEGRK
jgi:hypothetical protein